MNIWAAGLIIQQNRGSYQIFIQTTGGKGLDWYNLRETVLDCAHDAVNSGKDYNVFAVQYYGECYSAEGNPDYKKMRAAPNACAYGASAYYIYLAKPKSGAPGLLS